MSYEYKEELPTEAMKRYKEKLALLAVRYFFLQATRAGVVISCLYIFLFCYI